MTTELETLLAAPPAKDFHHKLASLLILGRISANEHRSARQIYANNTAIAGDALERNDETCGVVAAMDTGLFLSRQDYHDLRSALGTISQACELVAGQIPKDHLHFFEMISRNTEKAQAIMEQGRDTH